MEKSCIMFEGRLDQNSGVHGNRKPPLTYNGVFTFSRLLLIGSFLYLQVTRTCIKSRTSSNFGQIGPLTTELAALERLKNFSYRPIMGKWCLHASSFILDRIIFKDSGNHQDRHKSSSEFDFGPNQTVQYEVTCPWVTKISHFWTSISLKPVGQSWSNFMFSIIVVGESKMISNDQELIQSDPTPRPSNQKGNNQIHKMTAVHERHSQQTEWTATSQTGGHSATQNPQNMSPTQQPNQSTNTDSKNKQQQGTTTEAPPRNGQYKNTGGPKPAPRDPNPPQPPPRLKTHSRSARAMVPQLTNGPPRETNKSQTNTMMKQRRGPDRNAPRPTPGDPRGAEQHHRNTGAKENQQPNPGGPSNPKAA